MLSANDIQHGGNHYKVVKIQPWDVVQDWGLGYLDGTALKYISRWRRKGGVEDLKKAIHFLEKLIEQETSSGEGFYKFQNAMFTHMAKDEALWHGVK